LTLCELNRTAILDSFSPANLSITRVLPFAFGQRKEHFMLMPMNTWTKTLSKLGRKAKSNSRRVTKRRAYVEALEDRRVMTASLQNYFPDNRPDGGLLQHTPVALTVDDGLVTGDQQNPISPIYDSRANAHPIINFTATMPTGAGSSFNKIEATITLGGVSMGTADYSAVSGTAQFGAEVDATSLTTGEYNYSVSFTFWNGSTPVSLTASNATGHVTVLNRVDDSSTSTWHSEFGNGFTLPGLDRLYYTNSVSNHPDGVLLVTGSDQATWFDKATSTTFTRTPGPYDFSTVVKNTDGTFTVTDPDGSIRNFDSSGFLTSRADRNNNTIATYHYTSGNLQWIMDQFGRYTFFDYPGSDPLVGSITDFCSDSSGDPVSGVSQTTTLNYDGGNLISITDPDPDGSSNPLTSPVTQFGYLSGLLTSVTDPRAQTTTIDYDPVQRVYSVTDANNGVVQIESIESQYVAPVGHQTGLAALYSPSAVAGLLEDRVVYGEESTATRDVFGNVLVLDDAEGNTWTYEYDSSGLPHYITPPSPDSGSPNLLKSTYTFDDSTGSLDQIDHPDGSHEYFSYGTDNQLDSYTDPLDHFATTYDIDSGNGNVNSMTQNGATTYYTYTTASTGIPAGLLENVTDPLGNQTEYYYTSTSHGLVDHVTYGYTSGDATTTTFGYDDRDNLHTVTDGMSHVTTYDHDALDRLIQQTDPDPDGSGSSTYLPSHTYFQYDANSNLSHVTDPLGKVTETVYDARNQVFQTIQPKADAGSPSTVTKDESDSGVTYPTGIWGSVTSDSNGYGGDKKSSTTNGAQAQFVFTGLNSSKKYLVEVHWVPSSPGTYDSDALWGVWGNTSSAALTEARVDLNQAPQGLPDGGSPSLMWDALGAFSPYTSGGTTSLTVLLTDDNSNGHLTVDAVQLVEVGPVTSYTYDDPGNVKTLTDPDGNTTTWNYDNLNRAHEETNALSDTRTYGYYPTGELQQLTDRNGLITQYAFDPVNRTTTETWLDTDNTTVIRNIVSTYDADGRLIGVTDHDGSDNPIAADYTYTYTDDYSPPYRLKTTGIQYANMSTGLGYDEVFDANGQRTSITDTGIGNFENDYQYDHLGRETYLLQQGPSGDPSVPIKQVEFRYNLDSQFDTISRYGDASESASTLIATSSYGYDQANRLTSLTYVNDTTTYAGFGYGYDADNRLISSTNSAYTAENTTYTYDNSGQLLTADRTGTSTDESYAYDAAGNRLTSVNGALSRSYTTDPNNQLYSDGIFTYQYDAEGNRTRRTNISTGDYQEYHYDHRNRLTEVLFKNSGGTTTRTIEYVYDAFDRLIYESSQLTGFTAAQQWLVYDGQQAVLVLGSSSGTVMHRLLWGPNVDQALADDDVYDGQVFWNLTDQQNTVRDLVEYLGSYDVQDDEHNVFNSFGKLTSSTSGANNFDNDYTSRYDDSWTGLQWNGERWYDPNDGRWMSEDPVGFASGDSNLYRYVGNSPTNAVDPTGMLIDDPNNEPPLPGIVDQGPGTSLPWGDPVMENPIYGPIHIIIVVPTQTPNPITIPTEPFPIGSLSTTPIAIPISPPRPWYLPPWMNPDATVPIPYFPGWNIGINPHDLPQLKRNPFARDPKPIVIIHPFY
jgi:RHS repeat-associated protein